MKKLIVLIGMVGAWSSAALAADYVVNAQGRGVGTASITSKTLPENALQVLTTMELSSNGNTSSIRQETIYNADGSQRRALIETVVNKTERTLIVAEFDGAGAKLTLTRAGKTTRSEVKLDQRAPRANPSAFWFSRTTPKPNEKAVYYTFRLSTQEWTLTESVYKGQESISMAGGTQRGHRVENSQGITWLDTKGGIMAMEAGGLRLERVNVGPNPRTID